VRHRIGSILVLRVDSASRALEFALAHVIGQADPSHDLDAVGVISFARAFSRPDGFATRRTLATAALRR